MYHSHTFESLRFKSMVQYSGGFGLYSGYNLGMPTFEFAKCMMPSKSWAC